MDLRNEKINYKVENILLQKFHLSLCVEKKKLQKILLVRKLGSDKQEIMKRKSNKKYACLK